MVAGTSARESVKEMKRLKNEPLLLLVIIAIILFVGIFVIYPVVKVILFPDGGTYLELFNRPRWLTAIKNSLFMTLVSTISCTAVAFLFAYVIARLDVPCKGLFRFITLLPIVSPPFIVALSYILLFGVQGIITKGLLGLHVDIYGRLGLWIVQTVTFFPYAYSVIYGVMKGISTNLEYADDRIAAGAADSAGEPVRRSAGGSAALRIRPGGLRRLLDAAAACRDPAGAGAEPSGAGALCLPGLL